MSKKREARITVTESSGNVFADLGLPEPDWALANAQLASCIQRTIVRRRLSQATVATRLGLDQRRMSALMSGRIDTFSTGRLMKLLTRLGWDVDITVRTKSPAGQAQGHVSVLGDLHAPLPGARLNRLYK